MTAALSQDRFAVTADEGLGRKSSGTVESLVYFQGGVFVGASCANPVDAEDAPRVVRYDIESGNWSTVYESPLIDPHPRAQVPDRHLGKELAALWETAHRHDHGGKLPRDSGYASMCVFQGKSDTGPTLYVSTMSRSGAVLLRSPDGKTFEQVSEPGFGDPRIYAFRHLTAWNGKLFAVPAGTVTDTYLDRTLPPEAKIFMSEDPHKGGWVEAAEPDFGNASNVAISALCVAFGRLYAGTANPALGFELWKAEAGAAPFKWSPVLVHGGEAFNRNFAVCAMAEFRNALYVGTGVPDFGYETVHDIGPSSGELLRINLDGSWDLIAGEMRFTPDGLKVPLSLLGPGLGDVYNDMIRTLTVHDGVLYLGTRQWEPYRCLQIGAASVVGGYQLWASADGETWAPVIDDGGGNPTDLGIGATLSTPLGLFVGTSNQSHILNLLGGTAGAELYFDEGFKVLRGG